MKGTHWVRPMYGCRCRRDLNGGNTPDGRKAKEMRIAGNKAIVEGKDGLQRVFGNTVSHGGTVRRFTVRRQKARRLRQGAKIRLPEGYLPDRHERQESPASTKAGGSACGLHTLFAREHKLLCDELRSHYPSGRMTGSIRPLGYRVGADRQDPHGRVDPRHSCHQRHRHRPEEQLVWTLRPRTGRPSSGLWLVDRSRRRHPKTMPDHHGAAILR